MKEISLFFKVILSQNKSINIRIHGYQCLIKHIKESIEQSIKEKMIALVKEKWAALLKWQYFLR